jgi:hypothetical protein
MVVTTTGGTSHSVDTTTIIDTIDDMDATTTLPEL